MCSHVLAVANRVSASCMLIWIQPKELHVHILATSHSSNQMRARVAQQVTPRRRQKGISFQEVQEMENRSRSREDRRLGQCNDTQIAQRNKVGFSLVLDHLVQQKSIPSMQSLA